MSADVNRDAHSPSTSEFLAALEESGLFHASEVVELRDRFGGDADPRDASTLARRLITEGVLTDFQAERLLLGYKRGLVYGRYAVLDMIGAGAMGRVFKARHLLMDRIVALKMVSTQPRAKDSVGRFLREMKIVGRLDHVNVVRAYDADLHLEAPYIVMEYLDGEDLAKLLKRRGPLPPDEVIGLLAQAAWGLAHAHEKGVIHRDVKPTNLFLDRSGVVKVLDLGLGIFAEEPADNTWPEPVNDRKVVGTADYMSPEQIGRQAIDVRTDLFSLGCTMYKLLTGSHAFPGPTRDVRAVKRLSEKPVPITDLRRDVPYGLVRVVERLLATRPDDRFPSASEVAKALEALVIFPDGPGLAPRQKGRVQKPRPGGPPGAGAGDTPLDWSVVETALRPGRPTGDGAPPARPGKREAPPRPPGVASVDSHRKSLEAGGEESGRSAHQQYRKELIELNRASADDRSEFSEDKAPRAFRRWLVRWGEQLGDFLGEPNAGQVLIAVVLIVITLAAVVSTVVSGVLSG